MLLLLLLLLLTLCWLYIRLSTLSYTLFTSFMELGQRKQTQPSSFLIYVIPIHKPSKNASALWRHTLFWHTELKYNLFNVQVFIIAIKIQFQRPLIKKGSLPCVKPHVAGSIFLKLKKGSMVVWGCFPCCSQNIIRCWQWCGLHTFKKSTCK